LGIVMSKCESIEIQIPQVACITVTGPCQCGKSIVLERIKDMLEEEFGAYVVGRRTKPQYQVENLDKWEVEMVGKTVWSLTEGFSK